MGDSKHGKSTKQGRQRKTGQNLRYINEDRQKKGHINRIKKHLVRFPDDKTATVALDTYKKSLGSRFA